MTLEQRNIYEQNMNILKTVFDELGLEINRTLGGSDECNGWALATSRKIEVTAYCDENGLDFAIEYKHIYSIEELKEKMKLLTQ